MLLEKIDLTYEEIEQLFQELGINGDRATDQKENEFEFGNRFFGVKDDTISSTQTISYDIFSLTN